jgi:hypothetical protein
VRRRAADPAAADPAVVDVDVTDRSVLAQFIHTDTDHARSRPDETR